MCLGDILNLKEKFIKEVLKIKGSHSFETSKEDLIGFWFEGVEGEALSLILKDEGIEASTESPCIKKYKKSSGLTHEQAHGSLTIRWGDAFNEGDVNKMVNAIKKGVEKLRKISGWK